MQSLEELYGISVLYNGLEKSFSTFSKPKEYLKQCALLLVKNADNDLISNGIQKMSNYKEFLIENIDFDEKFMQTIEKHLINIEEEVPEHHQSQLLKIEPKRKTNRKYTFNPEMHKKSIILSHIKSNNYIWPVLSSKNPCLPHIFKRKRREKNKK